MMDVLLANPRGFCAGVDRAIAIVEQALQQFGAPIYVRHEVVHNRSVVDGLRAKGAVFVESLTEVPRGSTVVFSAHGVSRAVRAEAQLLGLVVFDATCPLVTKVHVEVAKMRERGREVVMIGHAGHPEVEGTMGQSDGGIYLVESVADAEALHVNDAANLAYVAQTTLSIDDAAAIVDAPQAAIPGIGGPRRTTSATRPDLAGRRKELRGRVGHLVIVVGSPNSSTPTGCAVAAKRGTPRSMIDRAELRAEWVAGGALRRRHRARRRPTSSSAKWLRA
jgi:4-hydroxy-3-methylbut-2-enyl diphosphate reductase